MKYSFIIPAYKSEHTLKRCIDGILNQNVLNESNYEIIIVLCRATESILNVVPKHDNIYIVHTDKRNRSFSRNLGSQTAKGEFLVFVDSDIFLWPTWVSYNLDILDNELVAASQGRFCRENNCDRLLRQFGYIPTLRDSFFSKYGPVITTGACIYRASIFHDLGGFNNQLLWNEDLNLSISAFNSGYALSYNKNAIAILLNETFSVRRHLIRNFKSGYYVCLLNRYFYKRPDVKPMFQNFRRQFLLGFSNFLRSPNRTYYAISILEKTTRFLGYFIGAMTKNGKIKYDFVMNTSPYQGFSEDYEGKESWGLLYINSKRCLYNIKSKEVKSIV